MTMAEELAKSKAVNKDMKIVKFSEFDCVALENRRVKLLITRSVGPRIISLGLDDGPNLLAVLPDYVAECPGVGPFHFYGGHRLWRAPEELSLTYLPDDSPVEITPIQDGLLVTQAVEASTGLQKSMEIQLEGETPRLSITHRLTNRGSTAMTCAPWAITQFRTGGVAILPQARQDTGVLPNRSLAMWPYTDPSIHQLAWGTHHIMIETKMDAPFKVGFPNPRGWLAYLLDGTLFVKHARFEAGAAYYDFGSSSEFYCGPYFAELETLAPIRTIAPGAAVVHDETWELFGKIKQPRNEDEVAALVSSLGLD